MKVLQSKYINVNGSLLDLSSPCFLGFFIVSLDFFFSGCRLLSDADI